MKKVVPIIITVSLTLFIVGMALLLVFLRSKNLQLNQIGILLKSPSSLIEERNTQNIEKEPSTATSSAEILLVTTEAPCENSFTLAEVPTPVCYQNTCTVNANGGDDCPLNSGLKCQQTSAGMRCVNPTCPNEQNCTCPPAPACYTNQCIVNANGTDNCPNNLKCQNTSVGMRCVNTQCPQDQDCVCQVVNPICYQNECTINADSTDNCPGNLECQVVGTHHYCVNPSCSSQTNCVCPTATPTPTPTPTPRPGCQGTCEVDSDCPDNLVCRTQNNAKRCVNAACWDSSSCVCPTYPPPKEPELPKAGGIPPTILFAIGGVILVTLGLIF